MTELLSSDVVRARLDFSYDGTGFHGWAAQPGLRTVQDELEAGLSRVVRRTDGSSADALRVTVAGRTDAGVHARGQVAHVDIPADAWERLPGRTERDPAQALRARLTGVLPRDIVVRSASRAAEGFDARFSALERRYAYRLCDRPELRDPLRRHHVVFHARALDVAALAAASDTLTGLRDFAAFCKAREGATTIRDLVEFSWSRPEEGPDAGHVVATVRADAFCHSMVRGLVGAVLAVGEGRRDLAWLGDVASHPERSQAIAVAPAHGLTLEEVVYPADEALAARAVATRDRRSADELEG
ncbi:tRNA pseudouridine(38-40) synthase TruA [Demequina zhanjiangensis]|uniref:tRNA pseudouridine synthase A n=1 Tax=Demequina zhanjiangensis TaxID=3051659 RepID=A0ABT8FXA9_9MICO|nr:tRNA pseudouridine(38-40) synthase TruA [Demequina sp. SYSU T00b26]MDN4471539.1 tRNA pseudouridine(38-40) synthase TruA [Demequina sp. SYSU T00b26]